MSEHIKGKLQIERCGKTYLREKDMIGEVCLQFLSSLIFYTPTE